MTARPVSLAMLTALTAFGLAVVVLHARETRAVAVGESDAALYVGSGDAAKRLFLSFDAVASDAYWMRAIQHYGHSRRSPEAANRFTLFAPLVDIATTLDPQFSIVYRFGALLLAEDAPAGPGRTDQAIALLEKGLRANPGRWQYAHDLGYVHYLHTRRFDEAARWFSRASAMPGAPRWLGPLSAVTMAQGGNRDGARRLLQEVAAANDGYLRRSAERGLAQLRALDDLDRLEGLVREFRGRAGRYPRTLGELRADAPLVDPAGFAFGYDPTDGLVMLSADSPLAPLPRGFQH